MPALRDAEGDLTNWRRSPLRPLLDDVATRMERDDLQALANGIHEATEQVTAHDEVKDLVDGINDRLRPWGRVS